MIGRIECQLAAPPLDDISESILSVCRRRWPEGVFLDADEDRLIPLASPELAWRPPSDEFFVHENRRVAETWEELGPCAENWNKMLHFIIRRKDDPDGPYTSVTVVLDEQTTETLSLLRDLRTTFRDAYVYAPLGRAA